MQLTVGLLADRLQVGRLRGLAPSYLTDELHRLAESEFRMRSASCLFPYPTLNLRRPSLSGRRRSDLEQSSAARHIRAVTSRLLHSLEEILLRTRLFIIFCRVCEVTSSFGQVNRFYLLTYLLTYEVVTTAIRLRFDGRSTAVRLLVKGH